MNRLTRALPHLITTLALLLAATAVFFYLHNRSNYLRVTESHHLTRTWDSEILELLLDDALDPHAQPLPCPAHAERTVPGKRATHLVTATITRAHLDPQDPKPRPTCDDTPHYLVNMTTGWIGFPRMYDEWRLLDTQHAREHPERYRATVVRRPHQPMTITALPENELAAIAEALP